MKTREQYLSSPLPPKLLKRRLAPIKKLISTQPSGIILGCPGSGRISLVKFLLKNKKLSKKKIIFFSPGDLTQISLESCLVYFLKSLGDKVVAFSQLGNLAIIEQKISQLGEDSQEIVCLVEKISELDEEKFFLVARFLIKLWEAPYRLRRKIKIFFLDNSKLIHRKDFNLLLPIAGRLGNLVVLPLLNQAEFLWHLERNALFYGLKGSRELAKTAWEIAGGMAKRGRELAFLIDKYRKLNPQEFSQLLLTNGTGYLVSGMEEILASLGESLKSELYQLMISKKKASLKDKGDQSEAMMLRGLGVITEKEGFFASRLIYFRAIRQSSSGEFSDEWIETFLGGREQKIYSYFKKHRGETVTKEEVAKIMWGKDWEEKYSEWAISRAIGRLNQKIKEAGGFSHLVNIRGQGYLFSNTQK